MNNTFLKSLVIILSISALVLLCLCVRQNRKQTALQLKIAELQKDVKGTSPQDTAPDKNEHMLSRPQKSLARKNDADFKEIRSKESQKTLLPNEISIQELAEKEPSTYQALVRILHNNIKELSKQRDKLLNLMVSLKPNDLLSEEDIELMQDKLDEQIRTIDANLAFQEPPKSKYIFDNISGNDAVATID